MDTEITYFDVTKNNSSVFPVYETDYFDVTKTAGPVYETTYFDVRRIIPLSDQDYSDLNITVSANTLSDTFKMSVPKGTADIGDVIKGHLLSGANIWNYDFMISEINVKNGIAEYDGVYNSPKLQYTYYNYTYEIVRQNLPEKLGVSVRNIISAIAGQLGLTLVYNAWDWTFPLPKIAEKKLSETYKKGYYSIRGNYQSVISELFGWLSMLPNINFSVTIRNGYLYVTQRGQEQASYSIQSVEFPPSIHRKKIYTEWAGSGNPNEGNYNPDNETQEPFTGTITFGDTSITYEDGLLISETRGTAVTSYIYDNINDENYLIKKETIDEDSCSKTEYHYSQIGDEIYLQREENWTDGDIINGQPDYSTADKKVQTHTPLGNGWYGTTVYDEDDEVISTSLSQGMPGNSVTKYMVDAVQDTLNYGSIGAEIILALFKFLSPPCISTSYPVLDSQTIGRLVDATDWLNNRIEETVTLMTADKKIIDTTMKVVYNGNYYSVESNSISHGPSGLRQNLVLKRWF